MKLELTLATILAMGASAAARDPVEYPPYPLPQRPTMKMRNGTHIGHNGTHIGHNGTHIGHNGTHIYTNGTWSGSLVEHRLNSTGKPKGWCATPEPDAEYLAGHNCSSPRPHHNRTRVAGGAKRDHTHLDHEEEGKVECTTLMRIVAAATPAAKGDAEEK